MYAHRLHTHSIRPPSRLIRYIHESLIPSTRTRLFGRINASLPPLVFPSPCISSSVHLVAIHVYGFAIRTLGFDPHFLWAELLKRSKAMAAM